MRRLGMPVSDDTLLRHVKSAARDTRPAESLRVVGVDDWAWRKGSATARFWSTWRDVS